MNSSDRFHKRGVFVVGCGSMGQHHLANLKTLGVEDLMAYDPQKEQVEFVRETIGVQTVPSFEEGLKAYPASVVVCTPPHLHAEVARAAVEGGADVLIEKPIAHQIQDGEELLEVAAKHSRIVMVGYNLRFHPGLQKVKELIDSGVIGRILTIRAEFGQYLPDWRPAQDYRLGYIVSSAMGGGIILDSSHEIDYVRWLGGEVRSVLAVAERISDLEMDTEDAALISMRLAHGVLAHISLDCFQRGYSRSCKVVGSEGTVVWDFHTGVRLYTAQEKRWDNFPMTPNANEMYIREMEHFLACVRKETTPLVNGVEGMRVLRIALAAKESARMRKEIPLS